MRQRSPLLPIFLIVLVDVLGMTIVIPLLAYYAEHFGATPLIATTLVSVYAFFSLISSPILGRLSDRYGRQKILILSQLGTFAGFIMLALANNLWLVFIGRILDGATAGNLSIAQAYISDHTKPENRAKAFGVIGVAFGLGFLFGPLMSGKIAQAYGLHAPFVVAACLSALSIVCTATLLGGDKRQPQAQPVEPDVAPQPAGRRVSMFDVSTYAEYFRRKDLAVLLGLFFVFQFSFSLFVGNFALFAERRFSIDGRPWGANEVGLLLAYTGFLGIILQGGLLGRLVNRFGERNLIIAGFASCALAYSALNMGVTTAWIMTVATISSFGNGVLRPAVTSLLSKASGSHEQGTVLGISQSLGSVAMAIAPPIGGFLIGRGQLLAWGLVMSGVSLVGAILCLRHIRARDRVAAATG